MYGQQQADIQPAFEIEKIDGFVEVRQRRYVVDEELSTPEKKRYRMSDEVVRKPAGYLVFFPKGHSIHLSEEDARAQGFLGPIPMVDMISGEIVPMGPMTLKDKVRQTAGHVGLKLVEDGED